MSNGLKKTSWTDDQLNVIKHTDGDLLVSASAGCGKTSVMNMRIARLILNGEELSKMIVTTFTKAAAADMKNKLSDLLFDIIGAGEGNAQAEYAANALKALPRAQISTLHSFCGQLIKDYFYTVGIDPEFEIMDENDASPMLYGFAEQVIEQMRLEGGDNYFAELCEVMTRDRTLKPLADELVRLYRFAVVRPDFEGFFNDCRALCNYHDEYMKSLAASTDAELAAIEAAANDLYEKTCAADFKRNIDVCRDLCDSIRLRKQCSARAYGRVGAEDIFITLNDGLGSLKKSYAKVLEKLESFSESVDPVKTLPFVDIFARGVMRLKELYDAEKSRKALADYSDLEHFALKILSDEHVINDLKTRFKYMFVDEYQDINPIQEEIISRIPAQKFFVGDIKQSIYAFRMCDPKIFVERDNRFSKDEGGKSLRLNANFRSAWNILDFANRVFSAVMTQGFGAVDYKNKAAFEKRDCAGEDVCVDLVIASEPETDAKTEFYSVERHASSAQNEDGETLTDAEINLVISRIYDIMEKDPGASKGNTAILLRTVSGKFCRRLKERLKKEGIAFCAPDKKPADECRAAAALIEYLRLIDNRGNDVALVSVMRSPLGGFTDEELCQIRAASDAKFFHAAANDYINAANSGVKGEKTGGKSENTTLRDKLTAFFDKLDGYTRLSYAVSASQTAGAICAENEYFNYVFARSGGSAEAAELAAFLDAMDSSMYNTSVSDYVRALERNMPSLDVKAGEDALKIMSIHASKGLEFDHVILPDVAKGFNESDFKRNIILDPVYGLALKFWDSTDRREKPTSLFNIASVEGRRRMREEEMRILYVAFTRAKKSLYITARSADKPDAPKNAQSAGSYLDWLRYSGVQINTVLSSDCVLPKQAAQRVGYRAPCETLVKKLSEYISDVQIPAAEPVKMSVTSYLKSAQANKADITDTAVLSTQEYYADTDRAMDRGTAYHRFMELFDYSKDFESEYQRTYLLTENADLTDKRLLSVAFERVGAYIRGRRFFRELPFIADMELGGAIGGTENTTVTDKRPVLVQGIIDLMVETDSGYEIIDYKTGHINSERLGGYSHQLSIYRAAAELILKKRVVKTSVYAVEEGRFIEVGEGRR